MKKRIGKIILIVLASLLILMLLLALGAYIYANVLLNKIDRSEITGNMDLLPEEIYEGPTVDAPDSVEQIEEAQKQFEEVQKIDLQEQSGIINILLIGSDRRGTYENGRSDSMMIVSLNYNTDKIHITSLNRAMYVCIPRNDGNRWNMLNAAYSWGGPNLLVDTVELNFRIKIDHYVVVDFTAFEKAVDQVGGVEVNLTAAEARYISSICGTVEPGLQTLNGSQARDFCQIRALDNDFVRTNRQRTVIKSLIKKASKSDMNTLIGVANEILPMVNTNMTNSQIISYIVRSMHMLGNTTEGHMLPIENESGKTYTGMIYVNGQEMYKVDFETNIKALHDYIAS